MPIPYFQIGSEANDSESDLFYSREKCCAVAYSVKTNEVSAIVYPISDIICKGER
jgi:hypothetical protein